MKDEKAKLEASTKLTEQQIKFVQNYARHFNGTRAAIEAGRDPSKNDAARRWAADMLTKTHVQDELRRVCLAQRKRLMEDKAISIRDLQRKLVQIIQADMGEFVEWGGKGNLFNYCKFVNSSELRRSRRRLVRKVTVTPEGGSSLELEPRIKAIELLGRSIGMFDQDEDGNEDGENKDALRRRLSELLEKRG